MEQFGGLMRSLVFSTAGAGLLAPPLEAVAQAVEVRVVEDSTRRPLEGVVVRLVREGRAVAMGLSAANGRVRLGAPAGEYQLLASRIGHESPPPVILTLAAGAVLERIIVMPVAIRMLPTLVVTGDTRCERRPGGGTLAAGLWEEVQTALTAQQITADQGLELLHVINYEQDLSATGELLRERMLGATVTTGRPFAALPASQLVADGFVQRGRDGTTYAAPDADVLLHESFVATHCFRVEEHSGDRDLIGLSFEPAGAPRRPDVRGTLWVDRGTRELRYLEYGYVGLVPPDDLGDPRGRVEFERLPAGTWIIREWFIRMPRVAERRLAPTEIGDRFQLLGHVVRGGRVRRGEPATVTISARSLIQGVAFDGLAGRPLAGAVVSIDGEPDSTITDAEGGFRLEVNGAGPRVLRASHPRLGIVADNSAQEVRLRAGQVTTVEVVVPPVERFARVFCGEAPDAGGALGQLLERSGRPLEGVRIRAMWLVSVREQGARHRTEETVTGARGLFAFCDLPARRQVTLQALSSAGTVVASAMVDLGRGEWQWVEMRM